MPIGNEQDTSAPLGEEQDKREQDDGLSGAVAAVVVVAIGAAVFEAALLPGIALGVAAVAAPKYFPKLGAALNPLFISTVRGTYKLIQKSKEAFAEAQEQMDDIVAEVRAESHAEAKEAVPKDRHAA